MPAAIYQHTFPNGLTLLAERMDHVRSAAVNFLVPAGCVYDAPEQAGIGSILADLITRGAGSRDSRALTLALDNLGLDRSEQVFGVAVHVVQVAVPCNAEWIVGDYLHPWEQRREMERDHILQRHVALAPFSRAVEGDESR